MSVDQDNILIPLHLSMTLVFCQVVGEATSVLTIQLAGEATSGLPGGNPIPKVFLCYYM